MGPAPASAAADFTITVAAADQTAAVLALLPELLVADTLPATMFVAHAIGEPSRLLGAGAVETVVLHSHERGFHAQCRVLPAFRRAGIGRALVQRLGSQAAAWDAQQLMSWEAVEDGPASLFMQALGFRVGYTLHHYMGLGTTSVPLFARRAARLRERERVPPGFNLLPLAELPRAPVIALHCREFGATRAGAATLLAQMLADPRAAALSSGLWDGRQLAGYLLGVPAGDACELRFWASDPAYRSGWAATVLLEAFMQRGLESGFDRARFHCNDHMLATHRVARRVGAELEAVKRGWALDLPAPA